ncbi:hypothetical protein ACJMQP_04215 [Rhodopseudomonas palustris]
MKPLCAAEIENIVERAVEKAVEKTTREMKDLLLALGINADSAKDMLESQKDSAWVRRVRTTSETVPGKIGLAALGAMFAAVGGVFTYFVKHWADTFWSK